MDSRQVILTTRITVGVLLTLVLAGCRTPARTLYYWGDYETLAYQSYVAPGKTPLQAQVEMLRADLQKAAAANLPAHPGLHAHLGYLYYQLGMFDAARKEFETEKALFPESARLMDRLLRQPKVTTVP
jgi:hypothetical protein